jgi:hypothetical protein
MRVANCKTVRREIEEVDYGEKLAGSVMEHLAVCGHCERFYHERRKLREMVGSLETVSAPPDFELGIRSRLANERVNARAGVLLNGFTFGFPSVAFATLLLVIGGVFALRTWNVSNPDITAVKTERLGTNESSNQIEQPTPTDSAVKSKPDNRMLEPSRNDVTEANRSEHSMKRRQLSSAVASSRTSSRLATKEFSSTEAPVVKKEEAVASLESSIFPIESSSQPLRLSNDYSGVV